jgi:hypothetical protein
MLDVLMGFSAINRMTMEQMVELSAYARQLEAEFKAVEVKEPENIVAQVKLLRREIKLRVADEKERTLREMKRTRASLRTTEEKRAELDKQIAALESESEVPA